MNTVRRAVVNVRYEWLGVRIGGPGASVKGQWPALLAAALVVFACFFAIGRLSLPSAPRGETSSALRAFSKDAAIPGGLHGESPIAGTVPDAIAAQPSRSAVAPNASTPVGSSTTAVTQPLAENASRTLAPSVTTQAPPSVEPTPAPAGPSPKHSASAPRPTSPSGGAHSSPSRSGSFDNSE
jgi:hypothetical protein